MTDTIEQRLQDAADAARRTGATLDRDAMLARIEGRRLTAGRTWRLALAAAAVAAAVIGAVAVLTPRLTEPVVVDPMDGGTAAPTPTPTDEPTAAPTPSPEPSPRPTGELGPSEEPHGTGDCSAAGMSPSLPPQPELPDPVAELRATLAELAVACDYEMLAAVGDDDLSFSFGASDDPAAYWRDGEERTEPGEIGPMAALRLALEIPPGRMEAESAGPSVYWAWPRLHLLTSESDQRAIEDAMDEVVDAGLHTRDEVEMMFERAGGYLGWRVMIELPEGEDEARWTAFVAGD